jgi:hypothetical protein
MRVKNQNSVQFEGKMKLIKEQLEEEFKDDEKIEEINSFQDTKNTMPTYEERLNELLNDAADEYLKDEEPENNESQKEDMKVFLDQMNTRIDLLVDALKKADSMICKGDENDKQHLALLENIREKRRNRKTNPAKAAYEVFRDQIKKIKN